MIKAVFIDIDETLTNSQNYGKLRIRNIYYINKLKCLVYAQKLIPRLVKIRFWLRIENYCQCCTDNSGCCIYAECRQLSSVAKHYSRHRLFNRQFVYGILLFKFQKRYLYRKRALFCGFLSGYLHFQFI